MTSTEAAFVGGIFGSIFIFIIAFYVLVVIACWKIFQKMGEPGWKSIIPFYNVYILFEKAWNKTYFWVLLGTAIVGGVLMSIPSNGTTNIMYLIGAIIVLVAAVIEAICFYKLGISFGHGIPFFILALFLPNIALLYLGFSSDQYQGNLSNF